jgi:capsular polysaccharide biosynthesis protein
MIISSHINQLPTHARTHARIQSLANPNEVKSAIENVLPGKRVELVSMSDMTFEQQMILLQRTRVLVGPHGAGFAMLLYLPKGSGVVEFTNHPPPYGGGRSVAHIFWQYAQWTNHPYRSIVNAQNPNPSLVANAVRELYGSLE